MQNIINIKFIVMVWKCLFTAVLSGAGNGIRTRDTKLGKLVLYQLSYARVYVFAVYYLYHNIYIIKIKNCKTRERRKPLKIPCQFDFYFINRFN